MLKILDLELMLQVGIGLAILKDKSNLSKYLYRYTGGM